MSCDPLDPLITTERVGLVTAVLTLQPGKHTTAELAALVGIAHSSAWRMLDKLSRVLPICRDVEGWYYLHK